MATLLLFLSAIIGGYIGVFSRGYERKRQYRKILLIIRTDLTSAKYYFEKRLQYSFKAEGFDWLKLNGVFDLISEDKLFEDLHYVYTNVVNIGRAIERFEEFGHLSPSRSEEKNNLAQYIAEIHERTLPVVEKCLPEIECEIKKLNEQCQCPVLDRLARLKQALFD